MNECSHIPTTHAYHDGELNVEQANAARAHINDCAPCTAELESLRRTRNLFRQTRDASIPVPLELMRRIHRQIDEVGEVRVFRLARRLTAVAAAILVVALVSLELGIGTDSTPVSAGNGSVAVVKPWESLAMMDSDPSGSPSDEPAITQFMVRDLSSGISDSREDQ